MVDEIGDDDELAPSDGFDAMAERTASLSETPGIEAWRLPGTEKEAVDYVKGEYSTALNDARGVSAKIALKALRFFANPGRFGRNSVVFGILRKTGHRHLQAWADKVSAMLKFPKREKAMESYLGITIVELEALHTQASTLRNAMGHGGGGGYRFLADGAGVRPEAALAAFDRDKGFGREVGPEDVNMGIADRLADAMTGRFSRRPHER